MEVLTKVWNLDFGMGRHLVTFTEYLKAATYPESFTEYLSRPANKRVVYANEVVDIQKLLIKGGKKNGRVKFPLIAYSREKTIEPEEHKKNLYSGLKRLVDVNGTTLRLSKIKSTKRYSIILLANNDYDLEFLKSNLDFWLRENRYLLTRVKINNSEHNIKARLSSDTSGATMENSYMDVMLGINSLVSAKSFELLVEHIELSGNGVLPVLADINLNVIGVV